MRPGFKCCCSRRRRRRSISAPFLVVQVLWRLLLSDSGLFVQLRTLQKKGKSMKCMTVHPSREKHRRAEVFSLTTRRRRLKITTFSCLCKFRYSFQNDANDIKSFVFKRGRNGENGALKEKRKPGVCFSSQAERPSPVSL